MASKSQQTSRASNVYTVNLPLEFKEEVLKRAESFGGSSELISLALDDFALKIKELRKRLDIVKEFNDYIKIEVLLTKRATLEQQQGLNTKLSFRVKDQLAVDTLKYIKSRTGWTTSRTVRVALLWYLFTNYGELFENENWLSLLRCKYCGYITHDQRLLNEHILKYHQAICEYCGKPYLQSEVHVCPQKLELHPEPLAQPEIELPLEKLVEEGEELLASNIQEPSQQSADEAITIDDVISDKISLEQAEDTLKILTEEIKNIGGTLVDIPEINDQEIEESQEKKEKVKKAKKKEEDKLDRIQSEISEMLKALQEDGILD